MKPMFSLAAFAIIVIATSLAPVSADLGYTCVGNDSFYNWTTDGVLHNSTTPCVLGCEDGVCISDASSGNYGIIFALVYFGFAGVMAYLAMNMDRESHGHLQILFMFLAMYTALSGVVGLQVITDLQHVPYISSLNETIIIFFPWMMWLITAYVTLIFIGDLFKSLSDWIQKRQAKKRGGLSPLGK